VRTEGRGSGAGSMRAPALVRFLTGLVAAVVSVADDVNTPAEVYDTSGH